MTNSKAPERTTAPPAPGFELATAVIRCAALDGDDARVAAYLDAVDDELLAAIHVYLPGGLASIPPPLRAEIRAAARRRRQARGWTDWPPPLQRAAAHLAGRPAGDAEAAREVCR